MRLTLVRYSYAPTETEGMLYAPPLKPFYTMEQPWVKANGWPAGVGFQSCIPEGLYKLIPYQRTNGQKVWSMVNKDLGVCFNKDDRSEDWQRYKNLIHPGNVVSHTQGCLLIGLSRGWLNSQRAVLKSGFRMGYAMDLLTKVLGEMSEGHELEIVQVKGARFD